MTRVVVFSRHRRLLEHLYDEDYVLHEARCEALFVWLGVLKGAAAGGGGAAPEPEKV